MSTITYPNHTLLGAGSVVEETLPTQQLPKVLIDLCDNLGIEPDDSATESIRPISDRCEEGRKNHQQNPVVERRKKAELLHESNEETIQDLNRQQMKLEKQRLDDVEAGKQNLDSLEQLAGVKAKLEILREENAKINERIFDASQLESYAYSEVLLNTIVDETYREHCEIRSRLFDEIKKLVLDNSQVFAQYIAADSRVDRARIKSEAKRFLNI